MKSPSAVRKTKKDMRLYRRQLITIMPDVSKETIESILTSYLLEKCKGRRHAMATHMKYVRKAAIGLRIGPSMGPIAIRKAIDERVAALEIQHLESKGIIETYSPQQKQIESKMVQSFSAKDGMRCT